MIFRRRKGRYDGPVCYVSDRGSHFAVKKDKRGDDTPDLKARLKMVGDHFEFAEPKDPTHAAANPGSTVELEVGGE